MWLRNYLWPYHGKRKSVCFTFFKFQQKNWNKARIRNLEPCLSYRSCQILFTPRYCSKVSLSAHFLQSDLMRLEKKKVKANVATFQKLATNCALPGSPLIPQNIHIQIVFFLLQNAFSKFYIYICLNCKVYLIHLNCNMYFSKTGMCIYPNCEMYLHNSFNLTTICAFPWITSDPQSAQTYFTSSKNSNGRGKIL